MKLAILLGISNYTGSGLCNLPGCEHDVRLLKTVLAAQDDVTEILEIVSKTGSADVKQQLIEFINKHKGSAISEIIFYYTGHGAFLKGEYYYLLSDYQSSRLRQTSLENSELDNWIRTLSPSLTTKLVDSCQSGVPYIKDQGELQTYLKGSQARFQNCYFMFSSQSDEGSYQHNTLSDFTRALGELIASRTGVIRHKDIIDYVSDSFSQNTQQTPFFVVQADFTDLFCKVDNVLQKKVNDLLSSIKQGMVASSGELVETTGTKLTNLVVADASFYCTEEEVTASLVRLSDLLQAYNHPPEALELFDTTISRLPDYSIVPNVISLAKWFDENKHPFFVEPVKERVKVRKLKPFAILSRMGTMSSDPTFSENDYHDVFENQFVGVRTTMEMPYASLLLKAAARYPNISSAACFLVPFVSRTHLLLFVGGVPYIVRGWNEESPSQEVSWRTYQERMKDNDALTKTVHGALNDFWEQVLNPIKNKFGLIPEDASKAPLSKEKTEDNGQET